MSPTKHHKKRLVLLDAHAIIHRAYHALPDFATTSGEPTGALYGIVTMLIKLVSDLKPDYIAACFDLPGGTHRHEVYEGYKGTRKKIDDALVVQLERSKEIFKAFGIPMYSVKGFEADDVLATIVEKLTGKKSAAADSDIEIIIASGDMDTMQLIDGTRVRVFTLRRGITDTVLYDEEKVKERFGFGPRLIPDFKGLSGDSSDNIIGVPGIGEKTATGLIQTFGTIEDIFAALKKSREKFLEKGSAAGVKDRTATLLAEHEDEARFSKMLATVRRDAPVDFVLPEKSWQELVDLPALETLFKALEFRTLYERVRTAVTKKAELSTEAPVSETSSEKKSKKTAKTSKVAKAPKSSPQLPLGVGPADFEKTALALWVVDSNISQPGIEEILNYANTDSFEEARAMIFAKLAKEGKTQKVYDDIEVPLMSVVKKMEDHGVLIDTKYLAGLSKTYHKNLSALEAKIWKAAGEEFNVNSPKQLGVVLFEKMALTAGTGTKAKKTAGGQLSTKESELEKLREVHPIIGDILNYRELQKLLSTYIDAIPTRLDAHDRLHAHFLQTGTTTGRISSQDPNMQNIPIKTELGKNIRNAFMAPSGFAVVALDYSQIELRVAAFLSGDQALIDIFKSGGDIHAGVASRVFGVPETAVDKEMRRRAKVINFGILYGMGINALRGNLGTSRDEAKEFYDAYFKNFPTLAAFLEKIKADAARDGYTETFFGRRRYFPGLRSKLPFIRAASERMAVNAPIQGTGADILKLAMLRVDELFRAEKLENDAHLIMTVHDELVFEVRAAKVAELVPKIRAAMEGVMSLADTSGVPLAVKASTGKNWGEMEEI